MSLSFRDSFIRRLAGRQPIRLPGPLLLIAPFPAAAAGTNLCQYIPLKGGDVIVVP
jgi:hypothetical protein